MSPFRGILVAFFLFFSLLLLNLIQTLSLFIKPFSQVTFRQVNRWAADTWWSWCDLWTKRTHGIEIIITGDNVPVGEKSIVVLNHQVMADIPVIFSLAKEKKRLGDLKWFVKDVIKYVPGIGWGMLFLDCLFIKRNWMVDKNHIHQVFKKILKHSIPLWLVTFAEGTRYKEASLIRSQDYARKNGLVPFKHVLIPRTKGFVVSVESLRSHIDAVYDLTIGYVNKAPSLWEWIKGEVRSVHLHVRRFPIDVLPKNKQELSQWLMNLFKEKDHLLDVFYKKGFFCSSSSY